LRFGSWHHPLHPNGWCLVTIRRFIVRHSGAANEVLSTAEAERIWPVSAVYVFVRQTVEEAKREGALVDNLLLRPMAARAHDEGNAAVKS
jgi:hypothetical protein